jgi:two-component system response regulator HydG
MIQIVVIDSSPDFADLIRQVLAETGQYEILAAHSANEGLDIIQEGFVRLAIVDFDLPDVNGAELVVEMRTVYPSLAVIAIPLSNTVDSPELEGLPIEGVLTKPFFPPHLPRIIADALEQVGVEGEMPETAELVDPSTIETARFDEDELIDEIQDLFEDSDFTPYQYPSTYDIEAQIPQPGDLERRLEAEQSQPDPGTSTPEIAQPPSPQHEPSFDMEPMDLSEDDTQEHKVIRPERVSPFADGDGWVDMGEATVDPAAETSELSSEEPPVSSPDEWYSVDESSQEQPQPEPLAELDQKAPQTVTPLEEPQGEKTDDIPEPLRMGTREFAVRLDALREAAPDGSFPDEADAVPLGEVGDEEQAFPKDSPSFDDLLSSMREEPEEISIPESSPLSEEGMGWVDMMAQQVADTGELPGSTDDKDHQEGQELIGIAPEEPVPAIEKTAEQAPEPAVEMPSEQTPEPMADPPEIIHEEQVVETDTVAPPPWLEDVDRAAQYLTRLSLETSAVAALLTRGPDVWAYAGELTQAQVQALTGLIAEFWDSEEAGGAIARFISLPEAETDFMFYGTQVTGGIILSLVFSAETPFGMIRRQAQSLARTLSEIDPSEHVPQPVAEMDVDEDELPEFDFESQGFQLSQDPSIFFSDLDLPPPDPDKSAEAPIPSDWVPDRSERADHLAFLDEPAADRGLEETLPTPVTKAGGPLPASNVDLSFSMVLVPRFPEHRLTGRLAELLHRWAERLCLAWDWRADNIEINPAFVAITLTIPPEAAPASVVGQLRDDLSKRVLDEYADFAQDLPSGRFWARGFLLKAGARPMDEHIHSFILQTRRAQGLAS